MKQYTSSFQSTNEELLSSDQSTPPLPRIEKTLLVVSIILRPYPCIPCSLSPHNRNFPLTNLLSDNTRSQLYESHDNISLCKGHFPSSKAPYGEPSNESPYTRIVTQFQSPYNDPKPSSNSFSSAENPTSSSGTLNYDIPEGLSLNWNLQTYREQKCAQLHRPLLQTQTWDRCCNGLILLHHRTLQLRQNPLSTPRLPLLRLLR